MADSTNPTPGKKWLRPPTATSPNTEQRQPVKQAVRRYDEKKPYAHMYNSPQWKGPRGLRLFILRRDPVCKECHRQMSSVADHVKDHRGDWKLFLDPNNVRGVCKPCHDRKTGSMHGGGDRKPIAPPPVENGVVANQGQGDVKPEFNDAVDYMALLKRQKK